MTEVPKIVYDRLRSGLPEQAAPERVHPGADLLTAFAEQALSAIERDGVLEHLALCGECREVVALALPVADIVAAPIAHEAEAARATASRAGAPAPHKLSFAWPSLRWAALAAGVAVAASVLLLHPGKRDEATLHSPNPQITTTAPPVAAPQVPSPSMEQPATLARTDEAKSKSELHLSKKLKAEKAVTPTLRAESGILLADNKKDSIQADKLSVAPSAGAPALSAPTSRGANETVEVSGAAVAVEVAPSTAGSLMARNDAPAIEKAKPALQGIEANEQQKTQAAVVVPAPARSQARNVMSAARLAPPASQTLAPNVIWAITGGVLQRSLDSGQSWQNALRADHPLLCYASHGEDVWTGGQAGTLFHSSNRGVTWVQVQPSIKAQPLSADITHIDVRGPAEIVLSAGNNEIWSSADGGKTWDKK
jgi:hypothetical protein